MTLDAAQPFMGLRIPNPYLANLTKKVMCVALISSVCSFIYYLGLVFVLESVNGQGTLLGSCVFDLLCILIIPMCGYVGAKWNNKVLTGMFCLSSLIGVLLFLVAAICMVILYGSCGTIIFCLSKELKELKYRCPWNHTEVEEFCRGLNAIDGVGKTDFTECSTKTIEYRDALYHLLIVSGVMSIPIIITGIVSFAWGKLLHSQLREGVIIHVPVVVRTSRHYTQPTNEAHPMLMNDETLHVPVMHPLQGSEPDAEPSAPPMQ